MARSARAALPARMRAATWTREQAQVELEPSLALARRHGAPFQNHQRRLPSVGRWACVQPAHGALSESGLPQPSREGRYRWALGLAPVQKAASRPACCRRLRNCGAAPAHLGATAPLAAASTLRFRLGTAWSRKARWSWAAGRAPAGRPARHRGCADLSEIAGCACPSWRDGPAWRSQRAAPCRRHAPCSLEPQTPAELDFRTCAPSQAHKALCSLRVSPKLAAAPVYLGPTRPFARASALRPVGVRLGTANRSKGR